MRPWMVSKFVSVPPSQRVVMWNAPDLSASWTIVSCACFFGADHQNLLALRNRVGHELHRRVQRPQSLLQVYDVNAVAVREDILPHLRVPAPLLVAEVNPRLQQRLHRNRPLRHLERRQRICRSGN